MEIEDVKSVHTQVISAKDHFLLERENAKNASTDPLVNPDIS